MNTRLFWILALVLSLIPTVRLLVYLRRPWARRRLIRRPGDPTWEPILQKNVPVYRRLPPELKAQLHGAMHVFLAEKRFEGCGGLSLTEEIKVTIAAEACLLLLNRPTEFYPRLTTVLVYPRTFKTQEATSFGSYYLEEEVERAGESWPTGAIVLAWNSLRPDRCGVREGNVALHEFAHQLDQEKGDASGVPLLEDHSRYVSWARVLNREFIRLRQGRPRLQVNALDDYGARNPAEFFAVATEAFFERPAQLKSQAPDLYRELQLYYRVDPAVWTP